jgi:hypothetical protein
MLLPRSEVDFEVEGNAVRIRREQDRRRHDRGRAMWQGWRHLGSGTTTQSAAKNAFFM